MAGAPVYSGPGAADLILSHPLESEDADQVGPGAYTLQSTATIVPDLARFGNALLCDANNESLDSDIAVPSLDVSDGAKLLVHLFWQTDSLTFNRSFFTLTELTFNGDKLGLFWDITLNGLIFRWVRDADLTAGKPRIEVKTNGGLFFVDTPYEIMAFIDSGSTSQGKIFVDGVDETASVTGTTGAVASPTNTHDFIRMGNFVNGLNPARSVDHFAMIQDPAMDDAKAVALAAQYTG